MTSLQQLLLQLLPCAPGSQWLSLLEHLHEVKGECTLLFYPVPPPPRPSDAELTEQVEAMQSELDALG